MVKKDIHVLRMKHQNFSTKIFSARHIVQIFQTFFVICEYCQNNKIYAVVISAKTSMTQLLLCNIYKYLRQSIFLCTLHETHGSKGESSVSHSECSHSCRWNTRSSCCWGETSFLEAKSHLRSIFLSVSHLPKVLLY